MSSGCIAAIQGDGVFISLPSFIYLFIYFVAIQVYGWVCSSYIPSFLVMLLDSLDLMDFVFRLLALHTKARILCLDSL
jgi:hypothetical protein